MVQTTAAVDSPLSQQQIKALLQHIHDTLFKDGRNPLPGHRERTAWWVVFRVLKELGVLKDSEATFIGRMQRLFRYDWGTSRQFKWMPQLSSAPVQKWASIVVKNSKLEVFASFAEKVNKCVSEYYASKGSIFANGYYLIFSPSPDPLPLPPTSGKSRELKQQQ